MRIIESYLQYVYIYICVCETGWSHQLREISWNIVECWKTINETYINEVDHRTCTIVIVSQHVYFQYQKPLVPSTCASCHLRVRCQNSRELNLFPCFFGEKAHVDFCQAVDFNPTCCQTNPIFRIGRGFWTKHKKSGGTWAVTRDLHPILAAERWLASLFNEQRFWYRTKLEEMVEFLRMSFRNSIFFKERLKMLGFREGYIGNTYYIFVSRIYAMYPFVMPPFPMEFSPLFQGLWPWKTNLQKPSARPEVFFQTQSLVPCNTRRGNLGLQSFQAISGDEDDIGKKIQNMLKLICFKMA